MPKYDLPPVGADALPPLGRDPESTDLLLVSAPSGVEAGTSTVEEVAAVIVGASDGLTPGSAWQAILGGWAAASLYAGAITATLADYESRVIIGSPSSAAITVGDLANGRSRQIWFRIENASGGVTIAFDNGTVLGEEGNSISISEDGIYIALGIRIGSTRRWSVSRIDGGDWQAADDEIEQTVQDLTDAVADGSALGDNSIQGKKLLIGSLESKGYTKTPARVVATSNITLSGLQTIDGVALAAADIVLATGQSNPLQNGPYYASTVAWDRHPDFSDVEGPNGYSMNFGGSSWWVSEGTVHAQSEWVLQGTGLRVIGVDNIAIERATATYDEVAALDTRLDTAESDIDALETGKLSIAGHASLSIPASASGSLADVTASTNDTLFGRVAGAFGFFNVTLAMIAAAVKSAAQGVESLRQIYTSTPAAIGTAAAGSSVLAAAGDHVHAHGAQTDGSHHAVATTSVAGFMSAADKTLIDAITSTSVTSPQIRASANGSASAPSVLIEPSGNSGLFWDATNGVVLSVDGADRLRVLVSGISQFVRTGTSGRSVIFTNSSGSSGIALVGGSPEGVVAADPSTLCLDFTNGRLYLKRTGTGNTGWVQIDRCESGTYTPTATIVTNLDSVTPSVAMYIRGGDIVAVAGLGTYDATATGASRFRLTLPIASAFTNAAHAAGSIGGSFSSGVNLVQADATNDELDIQINASSTSAQGYSFIALYRML